jgi:hypothetical protein
VLWTIIAVAVAVVVVFVIVWGLIDNFERHDHGGWAKAGWLILVVILPIIGTAIYLIARPSEAATSHSQGFDLPATKSTGRSRRGQGWATQLSGDDGGAGSGSRVDKSGGEAPPGALWLINRTRQK